MSLLAGSSCVVTASLAGSVVNFFALPVIQIRVKILLRTSQPIQILPAGITPSCVASTRSASQVFQFKFSHQRALPCTLQVAMNPAKNNSQLISTSNSERLEFWAMRIVYFFSAVISFLLSDSAICTRNFDVACTSSSL